MRIRKCASKLLFPSQQSPPTSFQSPSCDAPPAAASAASSPSPRANGTSSSATAPALPPVVTVCHLNQSPWDVLSPETYCRQHHHHRHQETEVEEEKEGCGLSAVAAAVGDGTAVMKGRNGYSSAAVKKRNQIQPKYEQEVDEHDCRKREKELQPQQKLQSRKKTNATMKNKKSATTTTMTATTNDKRTRKVAVANGTAMEEIGQREDDHQGDATTAPIARGTAMAICKKSDGKGWHCKREAKHPHSLCNYHLSQIRSYYHATHHHLLTHRNPDEKNNNNNPKKKEKTKVTAPSKSDEPEFYYYYSGFGPWRGKRRGVLGEETSNKNVGVTCSGGGSVTDNCGTTNAAVAASVAVHGGIEDGGDDGLDPESIDDVEDSSSDDVGPTRKRKGRKPIKARSLKSLL